MDAGDDVECKPNVDELGGHACMEFDAPAMKQVHVRDLIDVRADDIWDEATLATQRKEDECVPVKAAVNVYTEIDAIACVVRRLPLRVLTISPQLGLLSLEPRSVLPWKQVTALTGVIWRHG